MKKLLRPTLLAALAAILVIAGGHLLQAQNPAQPSPGGPPAAGGQNGPGRRGGGFDPARMEEMMMNRIHERLNATDTEWAAIKPLVSDVFKAQMQVGMGMRGRMGRGGPNAGPNAGPGAPAISPETQALSDAVDSASTSNGELKTKLKAYRDMVKKNQDNLKAAREKLRAILTLRQEADLVLMGTLD
jgi:hypothetical protein